MCLIVFWSHRSSDQSVVPCDLTDEHCSTLPGEYPEAAVEEVDDVLALVADLEGVGSADNDVPTGTQLGIEIALDTLGDVVVVPGELFHGAQDDLQGLVLKARKIKPALNDLICQLQQDSFHFKSRIKHGMVDKGKITWQMIKHTIVCSNERHLEATLFGLVDPE